MSIKKFNQYFLNESIEDFKDKFDGVYSAIAEIIYNTIETSDIKEISYLLEDIEKKGLDNTTLSGLNDDEDYYEFYLQFGMEIDNELVEIGYFDEKPSDNSLYTLYDIQVDGTRKAFVELFKKFKDKL